MGGKLLTSLFFAFQIAAACVAQVSSFPYSESFESGFADWVNVSGDDFDWRTRTGATSSSLTGPSAAHDGSTYLYVEASNPNSPDRSTYLEGLFDFTGVSNPEFSFYYHMYGSSMGTLYLDVYDGTWHVNEISISGEQQASENDPWQKRVVDLSEYGNKSAIKIRFRGETANSYRGDISIDLIECSEPCAGNPGMASVSTGAICTKDRVELTLLGYGAGAIQWQISTDNLSFFDVTGGKSANYTSDSLNLGQTYYFRAEVDNGCPAYSTVVSVNANASGATPIPYAEGFESGFGAWSNLTLDNNNWTRTSGESPSIGTGPSGASEGGSYLFIESSDPYFYSTAILEKTFDFSSETAVELMFDYHMYGVAMGELIVLANGTEVWNISGQQHNSDNASWTTATVDLNQFAGLCNVTIQFKGNTTETFTSDMAIDNVSLDVPCTVNTGVASSSESILCTAGTTDLSLVGQDAGGIQWQQSTDGISYTNIAGAVSANYTTAALIVGDTYSFRAEITNGCSGYSNVVVTDVPGNGVNTLPYAQSFEGGFAGWSNSTVENNDWLQNTGSTPSGNTGPAGASDGSQYLFIETSNPNYNSTAYLENSFDFSSNTGVALEFDYHMYGNDMGTLSVQANGVTVWSKNGQQNASEADAWKTANINLDGYAGACYVQIRIVGTAGSNYQSDMAIDNISLDNSCVLDAGNASASVISLCSSGSATLNLSGYDVGSIQWQRSTDNVSFSDIPGATVDAYVDGPLSTGSTYFYRTKLTSGCFVYSDTTSVNVESSSGVNTIAYSADWESDFGTWVNSTSDSHNWSRNTGATPSDETGPAAAQSGSTYLFVESSDPNFNSTSILETTFDFSAETAAYLSFYYHMFGDAIGSLAVDINGIEVWSISGEQHMASAQGWSLKEINLSAYAGGCNVIVAFRAETGSDFTSDIAIDNVSVINSGPVDWTGNINTDWNNSGNWTGGVPNVSNDIRIQTVGSGNYPVISSTSASVASLTVDAGASISVNSLGTLTSEGDVLNNGTISLTSTTSIVYLKGDWDNNGSFSAGSGKVEFNGSAAQDIKGSSKTVFYDLINNNTSGLGVTVQTAQGVRGTLELKDNTKLTNSSSFILESEASGTGQLAAVPSSAQYVGDMTIERYITNSARQWRYLASPVTNGMVVDWQNEFPITGVFTGASNISQGNPNNPSLYTYDETNIGGQLSNGYEAYPTTSNTEILQNGVGYSSYIRNEYAFTLDVTGSPRIVSGSAHSFGLNFTNTGNSSVDGWNLVGNPFPSAISWDAPSGWVRSNLDDAIYFTDNENGSNVAYVNGISNPPGVSNGIIPSSQAFWVKANGSSPVLSATEFVKSTSAPGQDFYRTSKNTSDNLLYIKMHQGSETTQEYTAVKFDSLASTLFDSEYDAIFISSESDYSVSTLDDENNEYAINGMPVLKDILGKELVVNVEGTTGQYIFDFVGLESFDPNYEIYLVDLFLGSEASVFDSPNYAFNITSDDASQGDERFRLRFGAFTNASEKSLSDAIIEHIVYPNPVSNGVLNVRIGSELFDATFQLIDMMGRKVFEGTLDETDNRLNLPSHLNSGVFEYVISNGDTAVSGKLVVQ